MKQGDMDTRNMTAPGPGYYETSDNFTMKQGPKFKIGTSKRDDGMGARDKLNFPNP